LLKLASLGLVLDDKSVKVARTSNLELDTVRVLLDASGYFQMGLTFSPLSFSLFLKYIIHTLGVLSTGNFEELLDILNLLGLFASMYFQFIICSSIPLSLSILPSRYNMFGKRKI
jgi:hypothetical protein